ncbi:MAG TPA: hypothetical protein VNX21_04140, partial [Candidatus Thermoplasmatota archaeon]|nr:hypothetical protein [Candidatus Thermoplasmatota archaeon]
MRAALLLALLLALPLLPADATHLGCQGERVHTYGSPGGAGARPSANFVWDQGRVQVSDSETQDCLDGATFDGDYDVGVRGAFFGW